MRITDIDGFEVSSWGVVRKKKMEDGEAEQKR